MRLDDLRLFLHVPSQILQAYRKDDGAWISEEAPGYDFRFSLGLQYSGATGRLEFFGAGPFDEGNRLPAMIGDTGLIVELEDIAILSGGRGNQPAEDRALHGRHDGTLVPHATRRADTHRAVSLNRDFLDRAAQLDAAASRPNARRHRLEQRRVAADDMAG